jgi:serine/threonine-protein kinase HipA
LSPAFDINPVENGTGLKLNISLTDNALVAEIALDVAKEFRITSERAKEILSTIQKSVRRWREVAEKFKISKTEQERMSRAFKIDGK